MRRPILLLLWLLTDALLFLGSYALAYFMRVGWVLSTDFPFGPFIAIAALVAPVWLSILLLARTFSLLRTQQSLRTAAHITYAGIVGTSLFALTYYFLVGLFFSRLLLVYAFLFSTVFVFVWHLAFERMQRAMLRLPPPTFPMLVIGATREAAAVIHALQRSKNPLTPVAILDARGSKETALHGIPVLGKLDRLERTIEEKKITHLLQCSDLEQSMNLLSICRERNLTYLLLPSVLGIVERDERLEALEGRSVTVVRPREGWWGWFFR